MCSSYLPAGAPVRASRSRRAPSGPLDLARPIVEQEEGTRAWFALQFDESTFGIFDVFPDDEARQTHLSGGVGQALAAQGADLFSTEPSIQNVDVIAYKLPGETA